MKKSGILLGSVLLGALTVGACLPLTACRDITDLVTMTHVSTLEEWKNVGAAKGVVLDADIDGNGETISGLPGRAVDGNGHTVSNLIVSKDQNASSLGLFSAPDVKNITLDSITLVVTPRMEETNFSVGFVSPQTVSDSKAAYNLRIENVHVKNSTMNVTQNSTKQNHRIGAIAGSMSCFSDYYVGRNKAHLGEAYMRNCSVDNVTIELECKETTDDSSYLNVGGLVGSCGGEITGCKVTNSTVKVSAGSYMTKPVVGGLVGNLGETGTLSYSYAENNEIYGTAKWYVSTIGLYSTSTLIIGGAVGTAVTGSSVTGCYTKGNKIFAHSSGSQCTGGFAGTLHGTATQSYSAENTIKFGGRQEKDKSSETVALGGFSGYVGETSVSSCFSKKNEFFRKLDYYNEAGGKEGEIRHGGFAGYASKSARFSFCADYISWASIVSFPYTLDAFCCTELEEKRILNCYIDGDTEHNVNKCAVMTTDDWLDPATVKSNLKLTDLKWKFTAGEFPVLDLG